MAYGCNFSKVVSILTKHMKLLPLQAVRLIALIPRVLPWARSFCPFRAYGDKVARIHNKNPRLEDNLQEDLLWSGPGSCDDCLLHQYRQYIQCRLMVNLIHYAMFAFYTLSNAWILYAC